MIDINCDMGESIGDKIVGNDDAIFPLVTSCNIACGFHGGDPYHIQKTIDGALEHSLRIGAHPSYPDLEGFGRREMDIESNELISILEYQIFALKGMVEKAGGFLSYVKPHGALYNKASEDSEESKTIIAAIKGVDHNLALMGLANSEMQTEANRQKIPFIAEAFADRRYLSNGQLASRKDTNSVIHYTQDALNQVRSICLDNKVQTINNDVLQIEAESICIHGDNPSAVEILKIINQFIDKQS